MGIGAYCYLLNALILSARIPFLDRLFGHDKVLVFHGYYAAAGFLLAIGHIVFKMEYFSEPTVQTASGIVAMVIFAAVVTVTPLLMVKSPVHRIRALERLWRVLSRTRVCDYNRLKLFHNSVAFAVLLIGIHVYLASSTQESLLRMALMGAWAGLALAVYLYHKFLRVLLLRRKRWALKGCSGLAPGICEFSLERDGRPLEKHRAGQFAYLRLLSPECGSEEHPFTISSAPGSRELKFTVKALGDYTAKLGNVPVGTTALVDGSYGVFVPEQAGCPVLFVAGGIGITPFLSVLGSWQEVALTVPVTLLWSCRTSRDMVHREFIDGFAAKHSTFRFLPVITREGAGDRRVDPDLLRRAIPKDDVQRVRVYFCGPDGMRRSVSKALVAMGVRRAQIHYERFS